MKRIDLDRESEPVKAFVRQLPFERGGAILELAGKPVCRVLPVDELPFDERKLRAAIRKRRSESRKLNREWESADHEVWNRGMDMRE